MSDYLAEEVVVEILIRLPTKSIIQCTTVCKLWYSLISSPTFISAHLNQNQDDYLLVRHSKDENSAAEIYALYCDTENFEKYTQFDSAPSCKYNSQFNVVGACNGLICLSNDNISYTDLFYLWNPSIRKSLKLPEPIFIYEAYGSFAHTMGFGFDPVSNDYKVVRIVHTGEYLDKVPPHVELYKLSTGVWEDITHVSPSFWFFERIPGFYMNGACHWIAGKGRNEESQNMIVLFDVHEERFREMMLPDSLVQKDCLLGDEFAFFLSDELLCLAYTSSSYETGVATDIWMMKMYGNPESWVKQFSVSSQRISFHIRVVDDYYPPSHPLNDYQVTHFLMRPIASRKNGEILWRADNGLLVSYDPVAENIKNLGICSGNLFPYHNALYVNTFKESLILLGQQTDHCGGNTSEEGSSLCNRE